MDRPVRVSALERSARNVLSAQVCDIATVFGEELLANAFPAILPPMEFVLHDEWARSFPRGYRVLSDNAYLEAAMYGDGIEVVPG
jgi:hypothetical protein